MKRIPLLTAAAALLLVSLACQTLTGGISTEPQSLPPADATEGEPPVATTEAESGPGFSYGGDSEFPMPDDATNVVAVAGTLNFQTKLSLDDVLKFYRDTYTAQGYTERELLTTVTDGVFSIVFDGDPSGQAVVIQGVDLGDGTVNVNISLQDV